MADEAIFVRPDKLHQEKGVEHTIQDQFYHLFYFEEYPRYVYVNIL